MPIYRGETRVRPFKGDHRPANLYLGETKLDGWSYQTRDGESLAFYGTYNDTADVTVSGNCAQNGAPASASPVPVLFAGTCGLQISDQAGIRQTVSLPALRRVGGVSDTYRPATGEYVQKTGVKVFDGTENWWHGIKYADAYAFVLSDFTPNAAIQYPNWLFTHGPPKNSYKDAGEGCNLYAYVDNRVAVSVSAGTIGCADSDSAQEKISAFKAWLAAQLAAGTPAAVCYPLAAPVTEYRAPVSVLSYYPYTGIAQDGVVAARIAGTAKVMDA